MANKNITGFNIGGETKKVDYNELVNKPGQPDWNETDTTSATYIKNKPFEDLGETSEVICTDYDWVLPLNAVTSV